MDEARARLPEMPAAKRARFIRDYEITSYDAGVLANDLALADYFEAAARGKKKAKTIANWILNDLQGALALAGRTDSPVAPERLAELVQMVDSGKISGGQAKQVFAEMFASEKSAAAIVAEKAIAQLSDAREIESLCERVIAANPKPVADFRAGNAASLNFLKGQVIKLSRGRANPSLVGKILESKLGHHG